jgi:hypothetical protein
MYRLLAIRHPSTERMPDGSSDMLKREAQVLVSSFSILCLNMPFINLSLSLTGEHMAERLSNTNTPLIRIPFRRVAR